MHLVAPHVPGQVNRDQFVFEFAPPREQTAEEMDAALEAAETVWPDRRDP